LTSRLPATPHHNEKTPRRHIHGRGASCGLCRALARNLRKFGPSLNRAHLGQRDAAHRDGSGLQKSASAVGCLWQLSPLCRLWGLIGDVVLRHPLFGIGDDRVLNDGRPPDIEPATRRDLSLHRPAGVGRNPNPTIVAALPALRVGSKIDVALCKLVDREGTRLGCEDRDA
jgi:hypothetical protein